MVRKTAKHVARNKKKYWRKISTQDIEDQLEDVRVQEITGYDRTSVQTRRCSKLKLVIRSYEITIFKLCIIFVFFSGIRSE